MSIDDKIRYGCEHQIILSGDDFCSEEKKSCPAYNPKKAGYTGYIAFKDGYLRKVNFGVCELYKSLKK